MREEYKIQRNGKPYVLYAGLLNEVHERFVSFRIETELIEASDTPIVKATFTGFKQPAAMHEAEIQTSGIGTAGRKGDERSPAARTAPLEMAETRAKARALRDAVNVAETALEELAEGVPEVEEPVSERTLGQLRFQAEALAEARGEDFDAHMASFEAALGMPLEQISEKDAKTWIERYKRSLERTATPQS